MNTSPILRLLCSDCGQSDRWRLEDMLARLRSIGKLRRAQDPDTDLVVELIHTSAHLFRCDQCGRDGLTVESTDEDDWPESQSCQRCGNPIPLQRLEVFPGAKYCMECQAASDSGTGGEEREFCTHCGGLMAVRLGGGAGISRYKSVCRDCGRTA